MLDEKVLLQVYFYKTYLYQQSVKRTLQFSATKSTEGRADNSVDKRFQTTFDWFYMYSPELFSLFMELRGGKKATLKVKRKAKLVKRVAKKVTKMPMRVRFIKTPTAYLTKRPQHSVTMCNNFFSYFFLHFFKLQSVILAKSLYKAVTANALFKHEHQVLLYRTRFLK